MKPKSLQLVLLIVSLMANAGLLAYVLRSHLRARAAVAGDAGQTTAWRHTRVAQSFGVLPAQQRTVFLGDSLTAEGPFSELFPGALNRGVKGEATDQVLARLQEVIDRAPPQVWLLVGVNDLMRGRSEQQVLAGIKAIVRDIKGARPKCEVFVQGLLPVNARPALQAQIDAVNARLEAEAPSWGARYVSLAAAFTESGAHRADGLHLAPQTYVRWAEVIRGQVRLRD